MFGGPHSWIWWVAGTMVAARFWAWLNLPSDGE